MTIFFYIPIFDSVTAKKIDVVTHKITFLYGYKWNLLNIIVDGKLTNVYLNIESNKSFKYPILEAIAVSKNKKCNIPNIKRYVTIEKMKLTFSKRIINKLIQKIPLELSCFSKDVLTEYNLLYIK